MSVTWQTFDWQRIVLSNRVKYTLEPLREFGFDALNTSTVNRVKNVRLVELWLSDPDDRYAVTTKRQGDDLFSWAQARKKDIHIQRRLKGATVKMRLFGRKSDVAITIRPPNVAMYNRGPVAAIIEEWLFAARLHHWRKTRTEISS